MKARFKLPKGEALPLGNSLRQLAMSRLPCWRPIGFSLNREFNLLHSTSDIVEDMVTLLSNLSKLQFIPKKPIEGNFVKERFSFVGTLKVSEMRSDLFEIRGEDSNILTSLSDKEVVLTIVCRFAHGMLSVSDNSTFLTEQGEKISEYRVLSSRHTSVSSFSFDIFDHSLEKEILELDIRSDVEDEESLLKDSIQTLKNSILSLEKMVSDKSFEVLEDDEDTNGGGIGTVETLVKNLQEF